MQSTSAPNLEQSNPAQELPKKNLGILLELVNFIKPYKLKVAAAIDNAKAFLKIQEEFGSFDKYIWSFVNYKPIKNKIKNLKELQWIVFTITLYAGTIL